MNQGNTLNLQCGTKCSLNTSFPFPSPNRGPFFPGRGDETETDWVNTTEKLVLISQINKPRWCPSASITGHSGLDFHGSSTNRGLSNRLRGKHLWIVSLLYITYYHIRDIFTDALGRKAQLDHFKSPSKLVSSCNLEIKVQTVGCRPDQKN